jgi:hypothetical protein
VCGLLVSSLAAVGCGEALAPSDGALPCGQGELVLVPAHSYRLFEASVVIETGFSCPERRLPIEHEEKFICAPPDGLADEALAELSEALDAMSTGRDRPDPVKPRGNAGQAAMAQDERAADGADEEAASSVEELQKSGGTEEASGYSRSATRRSSLGRLGSSLSVTIQRSPEPSRVGASPSGLSSSREPSLSRSGVQCQPCASCQPTMLPTTSPSS